MSYPEFHVTTPMTAAQLGVAVRSAKAQDAAILAIYDAGIARSPWQVQTILAKLGKCYPITSVRRSITGLQRTGLLTKLSEKRIGLYNRPEHLWLRAGKEGA